MNQDKIGKFIKKLRQDNSLTQAEFAEKYGVTFQAVSRWETGKNIPDVALLKQISKDFNVSIDDLLEGRKKTYKFKYAYAIILLVIIFVVFFLQFTKKDDFEFKTLTTSCNDFKISGVVAYNQNKSSIYISKVDYCGGDNNEIYQRIECTLYESHLNLENKIGFFEKNGKQKLEDYLKELVFNIDNYNSLCNNYEKEELYLLINATKENGSVITYKIPLSLNDDCNK